MSQTSHNYPLDWNDPEDEPPEPYEAPSPPDVWHERMARLSPAAERWSQKRKEQRMSLERKRGAR